MEKEVVIKAIDAIQSRVNYIMAIGDLLSALHDTALREETLSFTGDLLIWISRDILNILNNLEANLIRKEK